jgi:hypothetical protein
MVLRDIFGFGDGNERYARYVANSEICSSIGRAMQNKKTSSAISRKRRDDEIRGDYIYL